MSSAGFWKTERVNRSFILQKRKGHSSSRGLSWLLVQTWDSVLDTKHPPYRILYKEEGSETFLLLSKCYYSHEVMTDWAWLEETVVAVLDKFETPSDITDFVMEKVGSIASIAIFFNNTTETVEAGESESYKAVKSKVQKLFNICMDSDRLVSYYSATHWSGRLPTQGWVYLTINHLAFYSFILGAETKVLVRWTDVTNIARQMGHGVTVETREGSWRFSLYNKEGYELISQLSDLAMHKLISDTNSYHPNLELLLKETKNIITKSFVQRDLDARKKTEDFISQFSLPVEEKLDGKVECFLFTPYNKKYRYVRY